MIAKLREILSELEDLEPFPTTAVRVLEASLAGDPDPLGMARIIEVDAAMTAKVLRLANSAAHGSVVEVDSIEQAAIKLGTKELASLAMTSVAHGFYAGLGSSTPRSSRSMWVESVTNAIAARVVAEHRGRERPDVHYTVGLLMNMGHVVLDRFLRTSRDDVLAKIDRGTRMLRAEREVFGMDHAQIGARMALRWDFPALLVEAIHNHHRPGEARSPELAGDVNLAEALTWESMKAAEREGEPRALAYGVSGSTLRSSGLRASDLEAIRAALPVALEAQQHLFSLG